MEWTPTSVAFLAAIVAVIAAAIAWLRSPATSGQASDTLTSGQRWEVAKIVAAVVGGVGALLGLGAGFLVSESANRAASAFAVQGVIERLRNDDTFIKNALAAAPEMPLGSILAFAPVAPGRAEEVRCPEDWVFFSEGVGRFLLVAGEGRDGLTPQKIGAKGGEEKHMLTPGELPAHTHKIRVVGDNYPAQKQDVMKSRLSPNLEGDEVFWTEDDERSQAPHNNMPPYIALYFCKKV